MKHIKFALVLLVIGILIGLLFGACGIQAGNLNEPPQEEVVEPLSAIDEDVVEEAIYSNLDESMIEINDLDSNFEIVNKTEDKLTNIEGTITFIDNENRYAGKIDVEIPKLKPNERYIYEEENIEIPEDFEETVFELKGVIKEADLFE